MRHLHVIVAALSVAGCGSGTAPPDAPGYPGFHPAMPQLQQAIQPAHVIASPVIVPVYFSGDAAQSALDPFVQAYATSPVFAVGLTEYGVGAATVGTSIALTDVAPQSATETTIESFLSGKLDGTHSEFGAVDATTLASKVFLLYYPATTSLTLMGTPLCPTNPVYHRDLVIGNGARINYAVIARCSTGASMVASLASATAYATVAIATNPLVDGVAQGWSGFDAAHEAFGLLGSEVSSACTTEPSVIGGYSVSGAWSNAAAAAYHDPCVPNTGDPYFNSVPVASDMVGTAMGVIAPLDVDTTVNVQLFSDRPMNAPWTIAAQSLSGAIPATLDHTTGLNGQILHLTLHPTVAGTGVIGVTSKLGTVTHVWFTSVQAQ